MTMSVELYIMVSRLWEVSSMSLAPSALMLTYPKLQQRTLKLTLTERKDIPYNFRELLIIEVASLITMLAGQVLYMTQRFINIHLFMSIIKTISKARNIYLVMLLIQFLPFVFHHFAL